MKDLTKEEKYEIWKEYEVQKIKEYMATKAEDNNLEISDEELNRFANKAFVQLQNNEEYIEIMQNTVYDILYDYMENDGEIEDEEEDEDESIRDY